MVTAYFRAAARGECCVPSGENIRRVASDLSPFLAGRAQDAARVSARTVATSAPRCLNLRLRSSLVRDEG